MQVDSEYYSPTLVREQQNHLGTLRVTDPIPNFGRTYIAKLWGPRSSDGNWRGYIEKRDGKFIGKVPYFSNRKTHPHVIIQYPIQCDFDLNRQSLASQHTLTLRFYNLDRETRDFLYKDEFNTLEYRRVEFSVGYVDAVNYGEVKEKKQEVKYWNLPDGRPVKETIWTTTTSDVVAHTFRTVFVGNIRKCQSEKIGTEWITTVECYDGGYDIANTYSTFDVKKGEDMMGVIAKTMSYFPTLDNTYYVGHVNRDLNGKPVPFTCNETTTYKDKPWDILKKLTNGNCYIYNNTVYIMNPFEVINDRAVVLSPENGLLSSPKRERSIVTLETLLNPHWQIGQHVQLNASTNTQFNTGIYQNDLAHSLWNPSNGYKVIGLRHNGTVGGAKSGDFKTTLRLYMGPTPFVYIGKNNEPKKSIGDRVDFQIITEVGK